MYVHCDLDHWPLNYKINRVHSLTMANMSTKFDQEAHNSLVAFVFTSLFPLWPWPLTSKINRVHPLTIVNMSAKFDKEIHNGLVSIVFTSLFPYIELYVHCDFDLWPLTSKINTVHPLIMVNMSAKFDKETCNGVVSIVFTRSTPERTHTHARNHSSVTISPPQRVARG